MAGIYEEALLVPEANVAIARRPPSKAISPGGGEALLRTRRQPREMAGDSGLIARVPRLRAVVESGFVLVPKRHQGPQGGAPLSHGLSQGPGCILPNRRKARAGRRSDIRRLDLGQLTVTNHAREPRYSAEQKLTVFCGVFNQNCTTPFRERDPADRRHFSIAKNPVQFRQFYRSVPGPVRDTLSTLWTRAGSSMNPSQGGAVRRTDKCSVQKPA
jgi:hypothetical protein